MRDNIRVKVPRGKKRGAVKDNLCPAFISRVATTMINSKAYLFFNAPRGAARRGAAFGGAAPTDFFGAAQRGAAFGGAVALC